MKKLRRKVSFFGAVPKKKTNADRNHETARHDSTGQAQSVTAAVSQVTNVVGCSGWVGLDLHTPQKKIKKGSLFSPSDKPHAARPAASGQLLARPRGSSARFSTTLPGAGPKKK